MPKKKSIIGAELMNSRGNMIPIENVRTDHLKKHILVSEVKKELEDLQERMLKIKAKIQKKIDKFNDWMLKYNGLENLEIDNQTFSDYPGENQIQLITAERIEFDDTIQLAKAKIDECIKRWSSSANSNLKVIIDNAFRVDKKGFISRSNLVALKNLNINDKEWKEAMQLISDAERIVAKKEYFLFKTRESRNGEWKKFDLNFSSLDGTE